MKTRLLKKLRKKYYKRFNILKGSYNKWIVRADARYFIQEEKFNSIKEAKDYCLERIRKKILEEISKLREKHPYSRSVKYYPW